MTPVIAWIALGVLLGITVIGFVILTIMKSIANGCD